MRMNGPFEIEMKVYMTNGENTAIATLSFPAGLYPSREAMQKRLPELLEQVGSDFRLLDKQEFFNQILPERVGVSSDHLENFAAPGKQCFEPDFIAD